MTSLGTEYETLSRPSRNQHTYVTYSKPLMLRTQKKKVFSSTLRLKPAYLSEPAEPELLHSPFITHVHPELARYLIPSPAAASPNVFSSFHTRPSTSGFPMSPQISGRRPTTSRNIRRRALLLSQSQRSFAIKTSRGPRPMTSSIAL